MKQIIFILMIGVFLTSPLLTSESEAASHPSTREAWYFTWGLGWGGADADLTVVQAIKRQNGGMLFIRFGHAFKDRWAFGLDSSVWTKLFEGEGIEWTVGVLGASATYYIKDVDVYFRGGIGWGYSRFKDTRVPNRATQDNAGLALLGGIGYEHRFWENVAVGPQVDYIYMDIGGDITKSANLIAASLQVSYYWD